MTDAQIIEHATEFREGLLEGDPPHLKCMMVSAPLAGYFNWLGLPCELVRGHVDLGGDTVCNHVWIEFSDGRVLDATADQFNDSLKLRLPPVYLGERTVIHKEQEPWGK